MAARAMLDPYKATPPPRTGPPVPNMGGFAPPAASQPRSFVAAAPMAAAAKPGPVPQVKAQPLGTNGTWQTLARGFALPQMQTFGQPGGGAAGTPTAPPTPTNTGPLPPAQAPTVPQPDLGQDPTHGHFPVPQAGLPQQSANAAVANANAAAAAATPATTQQKKTGGGGGQPATNPQEQKANNDILTWINKMITGKGNFPVEMMKNDMLRATQGQLSQQQDAINADAAARGLFTSGVASRNIANAARGAASDYSAGVRDILEKKAMSDTQTRMQALGMKQTWLDSLRNANARQQQLAMAGRGGPTEEMITIGTNPDGTPKQVSQAQANWILALMDRDVQ